ncbi:MAG: Yip1 family protein [Verrucomicrobia bacterium]|nr:Yip1 family protein [Verrucomicrobiota bacterium]
MTPNPFLTIWLSPRETIRRIVEWNPNYCIIWLACLAGIGQVLDRSTMRDLGDKVPLAVLFAIALIGGPLVGLLQLYISSLLIRWTGRWLGGVATLRQLIAAVGWGMAPQAFALLLFVPAWLIAGRELFTKQTPYMNAHPVLLIMLTALSVVEVILGVWSFVTTCHTVAEVQGYRSAWRGLGNMLLAGLMVSAALLMILLILLALIFLGGGFKHVVHS